jgi:Predicted hydrolase (metallo-beta-lactamase superfamily)
MNIETYYEAKDPKFLFSLIDVGNGLMFLGIFPDNTTVVFDCNITDEMKENIIEYLKNNIPTRKDIGNGERKQWIDIFINSHRDSDHIRGLNYLNEVFEIREIWDSGQTGQATRSKDYEYYMRLRRTVRDKYGEDALKIPVPSIIPIYSKSGICINCLNSTQDYSETETYKSLSEVNRLIESGLLSEDRLKEQHNNSIVLTISYNRFRLLLTGDSDWDSWKNFIIPKFKESSLIGSDILIASHHGSRSFFTSEENEHININDNPETTYLDSISYINPTMVLVPCGDYTQYHHPNKEAMEIYKTRSSHNQVYTTNNEGSFESVVYSRHKWAVMPTSFYEKNTHLLDIDAKINGNSIPENSIQAKNSSVKFSIIPRQHGILEPADQIEVIWRVNNAGENDDIDHHEIYSNEMYEGNKFYFKRDLVYDGRHLLKCKVHNKNKKITAIRIFRINGNGS